jgi:hypothetical protein
MTSQSAENIDSVKPPPFDPDCSLIVYRPGRLERWLLLLLTLAGW